SFIEKIYTEPHGLRETENSQCAKCTACKNACPDINEENGYWKEIESRPKRDVYFAFPGLVFGFYFYYFLQAGAWSYYFGGHWTDEPAVVRTAFLSGGDARTAGFFFSPGVPRAVAAVLTLALCALASWALFSRLEPPIGRWLLRRDPTTDPTRVRHVLFSLAAFTAFVTFYTFAGAPTLRKLSGAPQIFGIVVLVTATAVLMRRLRRTPKGFAEESLGRAIVKRWSRTDVAPPRDLRDAFLHQTIRSEERVQAFSQVLKIYKEAVSENLSDGFVTRDQLRVLDSVRQGLRIRKAEHERVMAELAEEERVSKADPARPVSAEKRLQLETYSSALGRYLDRALGVDAAQDDRFLVQLRAQYRVTEEEHSAVLDRLLGGAQGMAARLAEELATIERAAHTIQALDREASAVHEFLADLLRRRRERAIDRLIRGLSFAPDDETSRQIRTGLCSSDQKARANAVEHQLCANVAPEVAHRLLAASRRAAGLASQAGLVELLQARTESVDPYVRAAALYALAARGEADAETLIRLNDDEHEAVRETARHFRERTSREASDSGGRTDFLTVEKIVALRSAPIFSRLGPEELAELARSSVERRYAAGEALCREGERGNEVFILLEGGVIVSRSGSSIQKVVGQEEAGALIGEMAVLDPAPRSATVVAGADGARVLRLNGDAFRHTLELEPAIADGVIRALARRLRGSSASP
ncbi:MAG TPA: cyclic nucleotide-binding domain-containing protein, partial [Thermoanaerobaculia bacterium]|nr:cyclic nucleotide-binding domain-containing protein [Thermoanaerobaculia bacterium]